MRSVFAALLVAVLLCGCSAKKTQNGQTPGGTTGPITDQTPNHGSDVVNIISSETLVDLIRLNLARNISPDRVQYLGKLEEMAKITVTDYTESGDSITASVTVVAPNMYAIAKSIENEAFTDGASLDEAICQRLDMCQDFITKTCTLTFFKTEVDWTVDFSEEFSDALYGGLISYRNEYLAAQEVQ